MILRKQLKDKEKELAKEERQIYDQEGRAVINVNVLDDSGFLSPYGEDNDVLISSETAAFLEHSIRPVNHKKDLSLIIKSNVIDDKEKGVFAKGIKNYYENTFLELQQKLKTNLFATLLLMLAGFVWFAVVIVLSLFFTYDMILEMISIAGWVFLWEAVDLFFLQRPQIKRKQYRAFALMNAKLKFEELKK